jgi:hypothetical protein
MGVKSWILPLFLLQILFGKFAIAELEQNTERISGTLGFDPLFHLVVRSNFPI